MAPWGMTLDGSEPVVGELALPFRTAPESTRTAANKSDSAMPKALPFSDNAPATEIPELTLEQYASLRAELAVRPETAQDTLQRYRLSPTAANRLDERWSKRLVAEPPLQSRYDELISHYKGWLQKNSR